jgi:hypothetical protein
MRAKRCVDVHQWRLQSHIFQKFNHLKCGCASWRDSDPSNTHPSILRLMMTRRTLLHAVGTLLMAEMFSAVTLLARLLGFLVNQKNLEPFFCLSTWDRHLADTSLFIHLIHQRCPARSINTLLAKVFLDEKSPLLVSTTGISESN